MNPGRILILDDDVELCDELGEILEDEGYEVTLNGSGRNRDTPPVRAVRYRGSVVPVTECSP